MDVISFLKVEFIRRLSCKKIVEDVKANEESLGKHRRFCDRHDEGGGD